ncbi:unnamed protein product [Notodromas monacha]|uniref:Death-inducer obliterator 1 n=1 Tax=Notodromas monacha TaxID=399045 RepID=A0A7R9BFV4_9CRUS|nr:unnamed protein product [Notodromas monacha]CAG0913079.1 unnamed protein product [Notodromas monacha]
MAAATEGSGNVVVYCNRGAGGVTFRLKDVIRDVANCDIDGELSVGRTVSGDYTVVHVGNLARSGSDLSDVDSDDYDEEGLPVVDVVMERYPSGYTIPEDDVVVKEHHVSNLEDGWQVTTNDADSLVSQFTEDDFGKLQSILSSDQAKAVLGEELPAVVLGANPGNPTYRPRKITREEARKAIWHDHCYGTSRVGSNADGKPLVEYQEQNEADDEEEDDDVEDRLVSAEEAARREISRRSERQREKWEKEEVERIRAENQEQLEREKTRLGKLTKTLLSGEDDVEPESKSLDLDDPRMLLGSDSDSDRRRASTRDRRPTKKMQQSEEYLNIVANAVLDRREEMAKKLRTEVDDEDENLLLGRKTESPGAKEAGEGKEGRQGEGAVGEAEEEEGEDEDVDDEAEEVDENDPNKLWCICQKPHNNRFMISCDVCEDWFHGTCVNITRAQGKLLEERKKMEQESKQWICPNCKKNPKPVKEEVPKKQQQQQLVETEKKKPVAVGSESSKTVINKDRSKSNVKTARPCALRSCRNKTLTTAYCSMRCCMKAVDDFMMSSSKPPTTKINVIDKRTGKILKGFEAPILAQLSSFLRTHQKYEIYFPPSPKKPVVEEIRAPSLPTTAATAATSPPTTTTTTTETKEKHNKGKDSKGSYEYDPSWSPKDTSVVGDEDAKRKPRTSNKHQQRGVMMLTELPPLPGSNSAPVPIANLQSIVDKKLVRVESRQPHVATIDLKAPVKKAETPKGKTVRNGKMTEAESPIASRKLKDKEKPVVVPPKLVLESKKRHHSVEKTRHDSSSSSTNSNHVRNKDSGSKQRTTPPSTPTTPDTSSDALQKQREIAKKGLADALASRSLKTGEDNAEMCGTLATAIEKEMFEKLGSDMFKYRAKCRSFIQNIRQPENDLHTRIISGKISPERLISLSVNELAPKRVAEEREKSLKHDLEMIKKQELENLRRGDVFLVKTHKGEVIIEGEDGVSAEKSRKVEKQLEEENSVMDTSAPHSHPPTPVDTSASHGKHAFDDNCKICQAELAKSSKSKSKKHKDKERDKHKHKKDKKKRRHSSPQRDSDKKRRRSEEEAEETDKKKQELERQLEQLTKKRREMELQRQQMDQRLQETMAEAQKVQQTVLSPVVDLQDPYEPGDDVLNELDVDPVDDTELHRALGFDESDYSDKEEDERIRLRDCWSGHIRMPEFHDHVVLDAFPVSGYCDHLLDDVHINLQVVGRLSADCAFTYVEEMRKSTNKEMVIVRFHPKSGVDRERNGIMYKKFFQSLYEKDRVGVLKEHSTTVKDFYLVPVRGDRPVPEVLLPFQGPGMEKNRQDVLLGILWRRKRDRNEKMARRWLRTKSDDGSSVSDPIVEKFAKVVDLAGIGRRSSSESKDPRRRKNSVNLNSPSSSSSASLSSPFSAPGHPVSRPSIEDGGTLD